MSVTRFVPIDDFCGTAGKTARSVAQILINDVVQNKMNVFSIHIFDVFNTSTVIYEKIKTYNLS